MFILAVSISMGLFCLGMLTPVMAPSQETFVEVKGTCLIKATL